MPDLYRFARPLLWSLEPETAHRVALWTLRAGLGRLASTRAARRPDPPMLAQTLWGLEFRNPIGVAAGFDKDAYAPDAILRLGFGSVEIGTVTPLPQDGKPTPRLFRLDRDDAIINAMGFPSRGLAVVADRLARRRRGPGILGINLGRNLASSDATSDYVAGIGRMAPFADYLVVNVSSPNTPGLRDLQRREPLEALLRQLLATRDATGRKPPLLVKIAPDLTADERADIAAVALATGIDGIVVANTTVERPPLLSPDAARRPGGLSGPPLFDLSTALLADMYRLTGGRIKLIGVGGVAGPDEAYAKIRAGASLVQVHTALVFAGMNLVARLKSGLVERLQADGFATVADAVGSVATAGKVARRPAPTVDRAARARRRAAAPVASASLGRT